MVIAIPAIVSAPDPTFTDIPELLVFVDPAPVAVAVPLPLPLALLALAVLFVEELLEETAGSPCTLILFQDAAKFTPLFPGV